MEKEEVQELENSAPLRIKFASVNEKGGLNSDASGDYFQFFEDMSKEVSDWDRSNVFQIEPRSEYMKNAHVLSYSKANIVAVEYETGIELLVSGVAINLASSAIIGFTKWGWNKWKSIRSRQSQEITQGIDKKVEPSLQLEGVKSRTIDGKPKEIIRLEYRPPLDSMSIGQYIEDFIDSLSQDSQEQETKINMPSSVNFTFNFNFGEN